MSEVAVNSGPDAEPLLRVERLRKYYPFTKGILFSKTLGNVKEGTLVTVHAEGDDNITFIQIGVPKQQ